MPSACRIGAESCAVRQGCYVHTIQSGLLAGRRSAMNDVAGPAVMLASARGALLCGRVWGGVVVCAGELGADLGGVGVLQVVKDGQCLLPGLPGLGRLAGGMAGVAEVDEGIRFVVAVAGFPVQAEGALVAGGGFGKVAQVVLGIPEAVPGMPLDSAVAGFRAQGDCLPAERA